MRSGPRPLPSPGEQLTISVGGRGGNPTLSGNPAAGGRSGIGADGGSGQADKHDELHNSAGDGGGGGAGSSYFAPGVTSTSIQEATYSARGTDGQVVLTWQ